MQPITIYTLGYARWSIDDVESVVDTLEAVLVDVRRSPRTTKPGFDKPALEARFGNRYVHVPALGNDNYKGGPIQIVDPERGRNEVRQLNHPPILMCGCASPQQCHRSTVATLLADQLGGTVKHLHPPTERVQLDLFGDRDRP